MSLPTESALISERDAARVLELTPDGEVRAIATVPGVVPGGEGGLLGLAARDTGTPYLYAYLTAANDNRIVRMALTGTYALGSVEVLLAGIPKARTHNGGRRARRARLRKTTDCWPSPSCRAGDVRGRAYDQRRE